MECLPLPKYFSNYFILGIEKWFPLKPIIKDEEVQGDLLVEIMIDEFSEVMCYWTTGCCNGLMIML